MRRSITFAAESGGNQDYFGDMVMSVPSESTPLIASDGDVRRRAIRRIMTKREPQKEAASQMLRRWQSKMHGVGGSGSSGTTGIEEVCKELEEREKNTMRFFWVAVFFIVNHIIGGALVLHFMEGWSFYDGLYFCIVTTTTVGYGDITPQSTLAKIYVIYYVVVSIGLISTMLGYLVGLILDHQEQLLLSAVLEDDEDESEDEAVAEYEMDYIEEAPQASINQRIIEATKRLDLSDYYGLGFSVVFLSIVLIIGVVVFTNLEKLSLLDAVYTTVISATTVGFGDFEPTRNVTKAIMTVWLSFSTIGVAKLVADFTDASVKAKQRDVSRRLLTASMNKETVQMMDKDKDGLVDKCEFVTEMLIRSGKVERKDVDTILLRFEQLDKNKSGDISADELS